MNIADKLVRTDETINIYRYDNGFMLEVGGRNKAEEWDRVKLIVPNLAELLELIKEAVTLPKDS